MYRLTNTDAAFLHMESERMPMHIASVQVLELPEGQSPDQFIGGLKRLLVERIDQVPYMTNRLQHAPLGLDQPVWVRAEDFDINRHVYRVEVPAPGGQAELEATIAKLHEEPLDQAHPLWEYAVLCGLANGRIAYYNRMHHACIDGMAGQAAIALLMDTTPNPAERKLPPAPKRNHEGNYSLGELLVASATSMASNAASLGTGMVDAVNAGVRVAQRALDPSKGYGAAVERAPRTRFSRPINAARSYAVGELPLADVKAVSKAAGCTVNDTFLAICGGGLKRYLDRLGETPDAALLAGCPVSLRKDSGATSSNAVSMMKVSLGTQFDDPLLRLRHIMGSASAAKGLLADSAELLSQEAPIPGIAGMSRAMARMTETLGLTEWLEMPINLIVSNVPGPRETLYSNGAKMLTHYPVSIPAHGNAVNITVQSYVDGMYFSITGCKDALPDADRLRDDLLAAYSDLCSALPSSVLDFDPEARKKDVSSANDAESGKKDDEKRRVA
ncbi:MAG: wax ester/triacylglycerol synthase family O-acyltransferase [Pseudomonadales bacterium]